MVRPRSRTLAPWLRLTGLLMGLSVSAACRRTEPTEGERAETLWERLAEEGEFVSRFLAGEGWFTVAAIVALGLAFWLAFRLLLRRIERSGYDDVGRLGWFRIVGHSVIIGSTLIIEARFFFKVAPLISLGLTLAALGAISLFAVTRARGALTAFSLATTGALREGDVLTVGDESGRVERLGLLRLTLRRADGACVLLPTRALSDARVTVKPREDRAEVTFVWEAGWTPDDRFAAESLAWTCPYRFLDAHPETRVVDRGIEVKVWVWGERHRPAAERWLAAAFAALPSLARPAGAHAGGGARPDRPPPGQRERAGQVPSAPRAPTVRPGPHGGEREPPEGPKEP